MEIVKTKWFSVQHYIVGIVIVKSDEPKDLIPYDYYLGVIDKDNRKLELLLENKDHAQYVVEHGLKLNFNELRNLFR